MTQDEEFQLYDEATRIHQKARSMGRTLFPEERQRLSEISMLLKGATAEEAKAAVQSQEPRENSPEITAADVTPPAPPAARS